MNEIGEETRKTGDWFFKKNGLEMIVIVLAVIIFVLWKVIDKYDDRNTANDTNCDDRCNRLEVHYQKIIKAKDSVIESNGDKHKRDLYKFVEMQNDALEKEKRNQVESQYYVEESRKLKADIEELKKLK